MNGKGRNYGKFKYRYGIWWEDKVIYNFKTLTKSNYGWSGRSITGGLEHRQPVVQMKDCW